MTTAEKQVAALRAITSARKGLKLARHAYLDELGVGDLAEAAAQFENAAFLLRLIVAATRRQALERRGELPRQVA